MDISSMDDDEFQTTIRKRLLGEQTDDCATQKVVSIDDVEVT
jgi:hypothetical protein